MWTGEHDGGEGAQHRRHHRFPGTEAVPALQPGVYVLAAVPASLAEQTTTASAPPNGSSSPTSGSPPIPGTDGVHAFVNSLATTAPAAAVELRLIARNNEVLATKTTDANGRVGFEPGLSRGEGGLSPALLVASLACGDYAFLSLKSSAFDLTDRGVAGRDAPPASTPLCSPSAASIAPARRCM